MSRAHLFTLTIILTLLSAQIAGADVISNVQIDVGTHAAIALEQLVTVTFDYEIDNPAGQRIWVVPVASNGYGFQPSSPLIGSGTASRWFKFNTMPTNPHVAQIEIRVGDDHVHSFYRPVSLTVGEAGVFDVGFDVNDHSCLKYGSDLDVSFEYTASEPVRIFARPFTGGAQTPNALAQGSPLYASGTGAGTNGFRFDGGPVVIDHVRLSVVSDATSELLAETFVPVDYKWEEAGIANIVASLSNPNSLEHSENLTVFFDYDVDEQFSVFAWGLEDGERPASTIWQPTLLTPAGSGTMSRWFNLSFGQTTIDAIRVLILDESQQPIADCVTPVNYHWAFDRVLSHSFDPPSAACLTHGEQVTMAMSFDNNRMGSHIVFARPFTDGDLTPGYAASGASPVAPGVNAISPWFTVQGGNVIVDEVRVQMWNPDQSALLFEWFVPVEFHFGDNPVTGIAEALPAPAASGPVLAQNAPNPFNPRTIIQYELAARGQVNLEVFDTLGRSVRRLVSGEMQAAGAHVAEFDGAGLASGTYFYRLEVSDAGGGQPLATQRKMMLVK